MTPTWALVLNLDNILLNNYWRKFNTYSQLGWDEESIHAYLSKKKNIMQIASFNTRSTSFAASSRRNRFYEIYNNEDMLDQDVEWEGAIDALTKISEKYHIYVISARTVNLEAKTREVLERLGFPLNKLTIFFKDSVEKLHNYRRRVMEQIISEYRTGVGICLNPSDKMLFERFEFTPIAFTSIKSSQSFKETNPPFTIICNSWEDVLVTLKCQ